MLSPYLVGYSFVFDTLTNPGIDRIVGSIGLFLIFGCFANVIVAKGYGVLKFKKAQSAENIS
jgi:hypothetical protein